MLSTEARIAIYSAFIFLNVVDYIQSTKINRYEEANPIVRMLWDKRAIIKVVSVPFTIMVCETLKENTLAVILPLLFMAGVVAWNYVNEWLLRSEYEKRYNKPKYRVVE
ncbi:MAG: hypothetical protein QXZ17_01905 [Nitrososphaerota archaeon]